MANKALALGAHVEIRVPECLLQLVPEAKQYVTDMAVYGQDDLTELPGTHLCLDFKVDGLP